MKLIRWSAIALLVVLMGAWGAAWVLRAPGEGVADSFARNLARFLGGQDSIPNAGGLVLPTGVEVGGPFTLTDHTGRAVTDESYRGKWMLVFFGFTFCPDVCPTELQVVGEVMDKLGPEAAKVAPIFVTIDPERDTPPAMADYVKLFDDRLIGLTGTPEQIAAVARAYRVYYAKVTPPGASTYLMDHSSFLYLMGPDGRFRTLFRHGASADDITAAVRQRMQRESGAAG